MTEKKAKPEKKQMRKYEKKLAIKGNFEDAFKVVKAHRDAHRKQG